MNSTPRTDVSMTNSTPRLPIMPENGDAFAMESPDASSAGATEPTAKAIVPIDVFLTASKSKKRSGAAYIWKASDVFRLRKEFRILGDFCGTLPKHTAQNQYLSVPLVLSYDELHFGVQRGFLRMLSDTFEKDYTRATREQVTAFYDERKRNEEKHAEEAVLHQEKQRLKQMEEEKQGRTTSKRGKKRARDIDKLVQPSGANCDDEVKQRHAKIAKTEANSFLGKVAFHIRNAFLSMFPLFSPKTDISGQALERGTGNTESKPVVLEAKDQGIDTQSKDTVPSLTENSSQEVEKTVNGAGTGRMCALLDRRKQQAKSSALIVTPTAASAEERENYEEIIGAVLPRGISNERLLQRQIVFADLYDKGYCMSCGAKFGADFLAYAGDPLLFHASLAVIVMSAKEEVSPLDIVALGRLGDSTKKRTVLAYVEGDPATKYEVRYLGVQWEETLP